MSPFDRRQFVLRALATGASLSSVAAFLEACSGGGGEGEPPKPDAPPPEPAKPEALGEMEKELSIYNWSDYIAEDTVANFEKEFGVKVTYSTYESNEEMLSRLKVGAAGYDIVVPSVYILAVLQKMDLLSPLHSDHIPNLKNVASIFRNTSFDPKNEYGVPWQWGTTGIAYRTDKITTPPDSWAIFQDKALAGKMTMMDDPRDVIGAWLRFRGKSQNSANPAELDAAKADALLSKPNLKAYLSAPVKGQLVSGDVLVAQLWNGDTAQARVEQPAIGYVLPKEGAAIWLDSLAIPKAAPHKRAAHAFMDYILRPEVGASISNFTGYGTPNQAAMDKLTTAVPYPTDEEMKRLEYHQDLGKDAELWDRIWTEIKAG